MTSLPQAIIRKHFLRVYNIDRLEQLPLVYVPVTERERLLFVGRREGCIHITSSNFRLDLDQTRDSVFNQTAVSVFSKDLHEKITKSHWYTTSFEDPIPLAPELVTVSYLEFLFYHHLKYIKDVYNRASRPDHVRQDRNHRTGARKQRKQTVSTRTFASYCRG